MKQETDKKKRSKLSRRITWRVIAIMGFFNLFIIGAVVFFDFIISEIQSTTNARYVIDGIDSKLTTMLRSVEIAATNNVAEVESNLDTPTTVFDALEHELQLNHKYLGSFACFEPDYYPSQGRWFEPYVRFSDSTTIERRQIGSAQHDYLSRDWYKRGLQMPDNGGGYLTDPYYDPEGGRQMLSSYIVPLHDRQGRRIGIYGIDLNLGWLLETIAEEEGRYFKRMLDENADVTHNYNDDKLPFFIQVMDSKGRKIAGSGALDDNVLKKIIEATAVDFEQVTINDTHYAISSKRIASTGWTLVVGQHWEAVYLWGMVLAFFILLFMTVGGIVIFFFTRKSIRRATKPLALLSASAQEVAKGNFDAPLPTSKHNDEVAQLRQSFDTMQRSLKQYVEELKASTAAKASIESELNVAHNIQMSMLPKTFPAFPDRKDIELYASLTPAKAVGGDLYDFFIREEKLFFCIGDVSGKGVPASLVMAVSRTLFRNIATHDTSPARIVEIMNNNICEGNDNCMFVTLFVGVLDLKTGHLCYCNAGHEAPYINTPHTALLPCDSNLPVGVMPEKKYTEQDTDMSSGTTIFLYTDGLTEAENAEHELFGRQRLANIIATATSSPTRQIEAITAAVRQFVGDTEQSDDLTMLAIKYK